MISALYLLIMAYCFFKRKYMKATFFFSNFHRVIAFMGYP